ncbi:MAG: VWA domain-containing protein [Candidatus Methanoplasma sp.]|jgi:magnesium chelatase subunit D|nr:VWA domain-containing protein [Candidatus Methanoplasma sp.]
MSATSLKDDPCFPFSAVFGMDQTKKAIMCALVSNNIRAVLVRGPSGVAKTTISRSIQGISGKRTVNIPLNTSDEQLFGGMDLESTLADGKVTMNEGLLKEADGNIIYLDDVNLMDQGTLISMMESVRSGKVILEREGISSSYSTDTLIIASMNPCDSDLSSHILDRFDICAYASVPEDTADKEEILRRNMDFIGDPDSFRKKFSDEDRRIRENIARAVSVLPFVTISDELTDITAELCTRIGAEGHRGDIAVVNTAKALAAMNDRDEVMKKDIEEAAVLCLTHRRNYSPPPSPPDRDSEDSGNDGSEDKEKEDSGGSEYPKDRKDDEGEHGDKDSRGSTPDLPDADSLMEEMLFSIGEQFRVIDYLDEDGSRRIARTKSRMGRRGIVESGDRTGRYTGSRDRRGNHPDIAFDATIRAAAPHQRERRHNGMAICIESGDIREKIRERRSGCTILFLVDASGSLGVRKRMATVKGAIMSMLKESYVKRDRIGMMAFRRDASELILPPTRSVEYSYRKLEELPTGGRTPLGEALLTVSSYMSSYSRSHPGEMCYIVIVTDGRANVPVDAGADANEEVLKIADSIKIPGVRWIVIDAGTGFARFGHARVLAERLGGTYSRLDELNADRLADSVKAVVGTGIE